jgi:serine/threonine protein kinase
MASLVGNILLNRFRIDALTASDETSSVYRGWDVQRNSSVTVRVLQLNPGDTPSVVRSIQQVESKIQNLTHPNIVPFLGLFQAQGLVFLVEQYIEGTSLKDVLQQRSGKQIQPSEAIVYLKAMGTVLDFLHTYGLVYCNLRPETILIDRNGKILLADFSAARHSESARITQAISGSPFYMAPELIRGESVTAATDIYGIGLLLFELLTGRRPFPTTDAESARQSHVNNPIPNPISINPAIPAGMDQVIMTALSKNPKERYQSIQEMLEIVCAVSGLSLDQIPMGFGSQTQVRPASSEVPVTMVVQPGLTPEAQPRGAPYIDAQSPGTQQISSSPQNIDYSATQVADASYDETSYPGEQYPAPTYGETPYAPVQETKKQPLLWVLIGVVAAALFLCTVVFVVVGLPLIREEATATPTYTATYTATMTQTSVPVVLPTLPVPSTQVPPQFSPIPPTEPPPPTAPPLPTEVPTLAMPSSFKVTVHNNAGSPVYTFVDGQLRGTDPIPPGKYIWYKSITPGVHRFFFCTDPYGKNCLGERQIVVDKDLDINVK